MVSRSIAIAGMGFAVTGALGGCGSDSSEGSTGSGGGASVDGCAEGVSAICAKYAACIAPILELAYGDVATCEARLGPSCDASLHAPGSNTTDEELAACAKKLGATSCDSLFDGTEICEPSPGSLADGKACGADGQCKSNHCNVADDALCGVCAPLVKAGGSCANDKNGCDAGLACSTSGTCAVPATAGGACSDDKPCQIPLGCLGGTCAELPGPGEACDPTTKPCDLFLQASFCNPMTQKCQEVTFADAGEPCGVVDGTKLVACAKAGHCNAPMGMMEGICEPAAADGAACDMDTACLSPAKCVSGACKLPDPAACK